MKTKYSLLVCLTLSPLLLAVAPHDSRADVKPVAPAAAADTVSAQAIATRVQTFYDTTRTFQARFEQVYHIEAYNRKKRSTGDVTFQRPGRMSWKYDDPNGNRVVSDGKLLKVYEQDKSQVVEQPLEASQYPAVLAFLVGKGKLTEMFTLRRLDEKKMNFEGGYVLEGTPKQQTPAYTKVIMYIDAQTAQVRRMLVIDAQRNRNSFTFSSPMVNSPVAPKVFEFTAPAGTQVVRR
jgi:outer membrane lipoprotein carrier protein